MPKETIPNRWFGQTARSHEDCSHGDPAPAQCPGREVLLDDGALHIGWTKGQDHLEVALVDASDESSVFEVRHLQLDRAGVNRLIRTLRKARDDAFGRD